VQHTREGVVLRCVRTTDLKQYTVTLIP